MKSHKIKSYNELCGNVQDHLEGRETRSRETNQKAMKDIVMTQFWGWGNHNRNRRKQIKEMLIWKNRSDLRTIWM